MLIQIGRGALPIQIYSSSLRRERGIQGSIWCYSSKGRTWTKASFSSQMRTPNNKRWTNFSNLPKRQWERSLSVTILIRAAGNEVCVMSAGQFIPTLERKKLAIDAISFVKSILISIMRKSLGKTLLLVKLMRKQEPRVWSYGKENSLIVPNNKSVIKIRLMY